MLVANRNELGRLAARFREQMLERRRALADTLGRPAQDEAARPGQEAEEDRAALFHDEYVSLRMKDLDWDLLREIDNALERLEAGEFGLCEECAEPIAIKRLQAIPWARYCRECQEEGTRRAAGKEELLPA